MVLYQFKLIIASIKGNGLLAEKHVEKPYYFNSTEEAKRFLLQRKKALEQERKAIWFYRIWEFGKEDYKDLADDYFKIMK